MTACVSAGHRPPPADRFQEMEPGCAWSQARSHNRQVRNDVSVAGRR